MVWISGQYHALYQVAYHTRSLVTMVKTEFPVSVNQLLADNCAGFVGLGQMERKMGANSITALKHAIRLSTSVQAICVFFFCCAPERFVCFGELEMDGEM